MGLLKWAFVFLIIGLIAAIFGFGNVAEGATDIAKILFFVFLTIFVILGLLAWSGMKAITPGD